MARRPDLQRIWRDHLEQLRRWSILATFGAYRDVNPDDLDASFQRVSARMQAVYGIAVINALDSTDEYMYLLALLNEREYVANWRNGRPQAPLELFGGTPFAQWMANAPAGVKALIAGGVPVDKAIETSQARAAQQAASSPLQLARSTTWNRFVVDSLIGQRDISPTDLRPWTDEVEQYANLWDGQRVREYPGTYERWQRVPSPGACGFCLMLATRTNYTSADAAMYAGGAEGTVRTQLRSPTRVGRAGVSRRRTSGMESGERYHRSCRCTVRMVTMGAPAAISQQDYERLTTRDADGNLPTFGVGRYRYTADMFDFEVVAGVPMPPTAPWKDAYKPPPRQTRRSARTDVTESAYDRWRNGAPA